MYFFLFWLRRSFFFFFHCVCFALEQMKIWCREYILFYWKIYVWHYKKKVQKKKRLKKKSNILDRNRNRNYVCMNYNSLLFVLYFLCTTYAKPKCDAYTAFRSVVLYRISTKTKGCWTFKLNSLVFSLTVGKTAS